MRKSPQHKVQKDSVALHSSAVTVVRVRQILLSINLEKKLLNVIYKLIYCSFTRVR